MKYKIDNEWSNVIIEKTNNKNVYIRVKEDLNIYVSANYFVTKKQIIEILDNNYEYLRKMIDNYFNVIKFDLREPSLHEIFVEKCGNDAETESAGDSNEN